MVVATELASVLDSQVGYCEPDTYDISLENVYGKEVNRAVIEASETREENEF